MENYRQLLGCPIHRKSRSSSVKANIIPDTPGSYYSPIKDDNSLDEDRVGGRWSFFSGGRDTDDSFDFYLDEEKDRDDEA